MSSLNERRWTSEGGRAEVESSLDERRWTSEGGRAEVESSLDERRWTSGAEMNSGPIMQRTDAEKNAEQWGLQRESREVTGG